MDFDFTYFFKGVALCVALYLVVIMMPCLYWINSIYKPKAPKLCQEKQRPKITTEVKVIRKRKKKLEKEMILIAQLTQYKNEINGYKSEIENLRNNFLNANKEKDELQKKFDRILKKEMILKDELNTSEKALKTFGRNCRRAKNNNLKLEADIYEQKKIFQHEINQLTNKLSHLKHLREKERMEYFKLKDESQLLNTIRTLKKRNESLELNVCDLTKKCDEQSIKLRKFDMEKETLKLQISMAQMDTVPLQHEIQSLQNEIVRKERDMNELKKLCNLKDDKIIELKSDIQYKTSQISNLQGNCTRYANKYRHAHEYLENAKITYGTLVEVCDVFFLKQINK